MSKPGFSPPKKQRRYVRYPGQPLEVAEIDLDPKLEQFRPSRVGLILQEAYGGCGLAFVNRDHLDLDLRVGGRVTLKVGKMKPLPARLVWTRLDPGDVIRAGFEYLDLNQQGTSGGKVRL